MPTETTAMVVHEVVRLFVPFEGLRTLGTFTEKRKAFFTPVSDLIHGFRFSETAIDHGVGNVLRVLHVLQGVFVQDYEVGQFPFFQGADVLVHADVFRTSKGRSIAGCVLAWLPGHPEDQIALAIT